MIANKLRIGNYVNYENKPFEVIEISPISLVVRKKIGDIFEMQHRALDVAQPIELTEEVLVNLLGKPRTNGNKFDIYAIPTSGIEIQDRRKSALPTPTICIVKFGVHICDIKYLHQLQNTYYCITGKELEVEL